MGCLLKKPSSLQEATQDQLTLQPAPIDSVPIGKGEDEGAIAPLSLASPIQDAPRSPSTDSTYETCPRCSSRLGPPLKASGRQVCAKCGWAKKPRGAALLQKADAPVHSTSVELPDYELKKLLDQAASESLSNMKPKRKQDHQPNKKRLLFPMEGERGQ